jgi:hypothetical protein
VVVAVLTLAALAPAVVTCRQEDINIKTGRARYSRYVFSLRVSEVLKDTPLSVARAGQVIDATSIQAWRPVHTFPLESTISPTRRLSAALVQADEIRMLAEIYYLTADPQNEIAPKVLTLWQTGGDCRTTGKYRHETVIRLDSARKTAMTSAAASG